MTDKTEIAAMESYFQRLWPIMRSITGHGVRQSHDILSELVPFERFEVPTGTKCFDWIVPKEWVCREAYVIAPGGRRILDIRENTLHLLNYSIPFRGRMTLAELDKHLFSLPEIPDAIPYKTSYYSPRWGFCLSHQMREGLQDGIYEVVVDTDHIDGSLTISQAILPGETADEVLISTYTCHPSMANNELSGPLVSAFLYRRLALLPRRRLTYRFVFLPETIGSITFLSMFGTHLLEKLVAGFVVSCVGDARPFTYMKSRRGDTIADRAAQVVLTKRTDNLFHLLDFDPNGSDERQYCSPGFNLPVGVIARALYGEFREYHTSLDNRDFISFEAMSNSVDVCFEICHTIDRNLTYCRTMPFCEPQLGRRGLYESVGGVQVTEERAKTLLWLLNLADGEHDLIRMAVRSKMPFDLFHELAETCVKAGLLKSVNKSL
ncbi:MAG: DUF4910 domain-containing protein [Candidatus Riflebacteria bacterium]|nr:DUF4910 domain-containing protein [Candidatus Riflebacteria bacterium]